MFRSVKNKIALVRRTELQLRGIRCIPLSCAWVHDREMISKLWRIAEASNHGLIAGTCYVCGSSIKRMTNHHKIHGSSLESLAYLLLPKLLIPVWVQRQGTAGFSPLLPHKAKITNNDTFRYWTPWRKRAKPVTKYKHIIHEAQIPLLINSTVEWSFTFTVIV